MADILISENSGFCFGVRRAVEIALKEGQKGGKTYTLGPIIHNSNVVDYLKTHGVSAVSSISELDSDSVVIIRSHGVPASIIHELKERKMKFIDATCPYVSKIHRIVREWASEGYQIIIIGKPDHPEVLGISGQCDTALVFADEIGLEEFLKSHEEMREKPICMVAQTTIEKEIFIKCEKILKKCCTNYKIFDTICRATSKRQEEAVELSQKVDTMFVIGDKNSANTKGLFEIAKKYAARAYFIESADDIEGNMLHGAGVIGITAGASTPDWIIKEVKDSMSDEIGVVSNGESFEELLDQTFKTINTGDKVKGIVTDITPTEICVDLGAKQSGYLSLSEFSDDPEFDPNTSFKKGDEIEAIAVRVNDIDGMVNLSVKRLNALKSWDEVETLRQADQPVEGLVISENSGGIVVLVRGARVFVPASQSGLPKEAEMSQLVNKKVKLKITEVNKFKKRIVGSIRAVTGALKKEAEEKVWAEIAVGNKYKGVVKSVTAFGAFVDIGGVDGLLHLSEMSWNRIYKPSDMVAVGDEIDVFVLGIDSEKRKISLGHRKPEDNPWTKYGDKVAIGEVLPVKIIKFMPFGAFAEIFPGIDGLIHISQISDKRIARANEVLKEGQVVDAKITDVDLEKKKVSLSIRALIPGQEETVIDQAARAAADEIVATSEAAADSVAEAGEAAANEIISE